MRIPFAGAIALILLTLFVDCYIFRDIRQYSRAGCQRRNSIIYGILTALCWAALCVILFYPLKNGENSILPLMWILYSFISVYIAKLIYCLSSLVGRMFVRKNRHINYGIYFGMSLGAALFAVMWWGVAFTRHEIRVNNVKIESDKLPAAFHGFKVLQFSDAHVGTWGNDTTFISQLVDSINACRPDVVMFTGDIVNRKSDELLPFRKVLSRIYAPHGVYAVLGNHDYGQYVKWDNPGDAEADTRKLVGMMENMGWKVLNNKTDFIRVGTDSIAVIGVENWGEPPFNQRGNLSAAYRPDDKTGESLYDSNYKILLTHNPEHWGQVATKTSNINLSLAGHTHAMQSMIGVGKWKWSPAKFRYSRWGGLYIEESADGTPMNLYVNIGSGEVGFPARIGIAYPELTLFSLEQSN
ncbi:MAG: metallophosphoesterase [Candidatus Amulumruptor caecigallinarius]|nr:metallophosphoesterase [Candidatus Amulumruptor caecigallinarius]